MEYVSQEICKMVHASFGESYCEWVGALRDIKRIVSPKSTDYEFAKTLLDIPLEDRYNYLVNITEAYKRERGKVRDAVLTRINADLASLRVEVGKQ